MDVSLWLPQAGRDTKPRLLPADTDTISIDVVKVASVSVFVKCANYAKHTRKQPECILGIYGSKTHPTLWFPTIRHHRTICWWRRIYSLVICISFLYSLSTYSGSSFTKFFSEEISHGCPFNLNILSSFRQ